MNKTEFIAAIKALKNKEKWGNTLDKRRVKRYNSI